MTSQICSIMLNDVSVRERWQKFLKVTAGKKSAIFPYSTQLLIESKNMYNIWYKKTFSNYRIYFEKS